MGLKLLLLLALISFSACGKDRKKDHIIAKIPEASGICYHPHFKTLFAVSDQGKLYELTTKGKILRKRDIGNYDLEGITCDLIHNRLLAVDEGRDNILIINPKTLRIQKKISVERSFQGHKILVKDKEYGLEGITIDPTGTVYISNQSYRKFPAKDPSVIALVKEISGKKTAILSLIDPGRRDISGLCYRNGYLYMVSDSNDRLYRYNFKTKKIDFSAKLPKFAQEGITFDEKGNIYFANDNGTILKYKAKKFGIYD